MTKHLSSLKEKRILAGTMIIFGALIFFLSFWDEFEKDSFSWLGLFLLIVGITGFHKEKSWSELSSQERKWRIVLMIIIALLCFLLVLFYFLV
jgi:uncharacterized membrane protein HdeD (DUF308 family)